MVRRYLCSLGFHETKRSAHKHEYRRTVPTSDINQSKVPEFVAGRDGPGDSIAKYLQHTISTMYTIRPITAWLADDANFLHENSQ